jgi:hypothetical protein
MNHPPAHLHRVHSPLLSPVKPVQTWQEQSHAGLLKGLHPHSIHPNDLLLGKLVIES